MEYDRKLLSDVKKLMIARYPRFATEIAEARLEYKTNLKYHTAATDGKNVYFDPDYLASLSDDDRLFITAHELMHIKFEHMFRINGKDGKMRDLDIWNRATDAIINANLERDGFKIKEGYVNMPEALKYSSEEFYEILLKESEKQKQSGKGQDGQSNQGQNGQGGQNQNGQNTQQSQEQNGQDGQNQNENGGQNQGQQIDEEQGKENGQGQHSQGQQSGQDENSQSGQNSGGGNQFADDHSLWEKAFEESMQSGKGQKSGEGQKQNSDESQQASEKSKDTKYQSNSDLPEFEDVKLEESFRFNENSEFSENRELRREIARQRFEKMREKAFQKPENGNIELGEVGEAKSIIDWKLLLRREVEKTETIWSQRRSMAENNYAYRLEENDIEDEAETEVMIDVSGSVSLDMVKAFLRQLKPLLKESKLRVGCFNEKFWGMVEIKSDRDIDNFKIPSDARGESAWTEDWDLAVRSFSKKREVNKIVFTDGHPAPGTMPKEDLKGTNVIWLVYSNRNFNPCCGKVIDIYPKDLENMVGAMLEDDEPELSM